MVGGALGGVVFAGGAVASFRSMTLVHSAFQTSYAHFSLRLRKEILANYDSEIETLKSNLDSQGEKGHIPNNAHPAHRPSNIPSFRSSSVAVTPFAKYVEAEMATCKVRKKDSEELKQQSRALRFEVEDSSSSFIGGFRSDGNR